MHAEIIEYLRHLERDGRTSTMTGYERALRQFDAWLESESLDPKAVTLSDLQRYQRWLSEEYRTIENAALKRTTQAMRLAAMKCRTANASWVAAWSFSSSETRPRQKSDEMTSVGLKWVRANVDLPAPDGPTRTTSASSGIVMRRSATDEDPHLRRCADIGILGAYGQKPHPIAEASPDVAAP